MRWKKKTARVPGEPEKPPEQPGTREWQRARSQESWAYFQLKKAKDVVPLVGGMSTTQKRTHRIARFMGFKALANAKKLRIAAYLEGYIPHQFTRGVKYDEFDQPVEGSKSEFERWQSKLDPETLALVEKRRADYAQMCSDDGYVAMWKLRPPRKKRRPAPTFKAAGE